MRDQKDGTNMELSFIFFGVSIHSYFFSRRLHYLVSMYYMTRTLKHYMHIRLYYYCSLLLCVLWRKSPCTLAQDYTTTCRKISIAVIISVGDEIIRVSSYHRNQSAYNDNTSLVADLSSPFYMEIDLSGLD